MLDVGSEICDVLASNTKNATSVRAAIKEFGGAVAWTYFFSDGARELKKVATDLGPTVHLSSTPRSPQLISDQRVTGTPAVRREVIRSQLTITK